MLGLRSAIFQILRLRNVCRRWGTSINKQFTFFPPHTHCYMSDESPCAKAVGPSAKRWHQPSGGQPPGNPSCLERSRIAGECCVDVEGIRRMPCAPLHTHAHTCQDTPQCGECSYATLLCNPTALLAAVVPPGRHSVTVMCTLKGPI